MPQNKLQMLLQNPSIQQMISRVQPTHRSECRGGMRPCPHTMCVYHLYFRKQPDGGPSLCAQGLEVWELKESCQLDALEREQPVPPDTPLQGQTQPEDNLNTITRKLPPLLRKG